MKDQAQTTIRLCRRKFFPAVLKYLTEIAASVNEVSAAGTDSSVQKELLDEITFAFRDAKDSFDRLVSDFTEESFQEDHIREDLAELDPLLKALEDLIDEEYWNESL